MTLAIEQMRASTSRGPKVGAVIVRSGRVIATGRRAPNLHAERVAIESAIANGHDLRGATLFTTLEPCVSVGGAREPCAALIARVGIDTVYIGRYDPNPLVNRLGWKVLRDAGVALRDFTADLRSEIDEINQTFVEHFVSGVGPTGGAKFDYQFNGGRFEIQFSPDDERSIVTQWTHRGSGSIYAYAVMPVTVCLAKYAASFSEIDDPEAFDFNYTVPVHEGEIVVFRSPVGAVLVLVEEVHAGAHTGASQRFVKVKFEVRPGSDA
jgi:diaminohydroxyphosphoribosylaminopyrimidine deaminase/5-amino-6-(5-phosphoribosylamino)uracil reductase